MMKVKNLAGGESVLFTSDIEIDYWEKRTMLSNWEWNVDTMKKVFFKENKISFILYWIVVGHTMSRAAGTLQTTYNASQFF